MSGVVGSDYAARCFGSFSDNFYLASVGLERAESKHAADWPSLRYKNTLFFMMEQEIFGHLCREHGLHY